MKKRDVVNLFVLIVLMIFTIFYKLVLVTKYVRYELLTVSFFLIVLTFVSYLLLGYRITKENRKRKAAKELIIYEIIMYFLIFYGSGLFLGYQKNFYSLNPITILSNIIYPAIIVVTSEILRNIVIQANKDKKAVIITLTILLALIEMMETINYYSVGTIEGLFKLFALNLVPLTTKHAVLSYLTYNTGLRNSLTYRAFLTLYVFVVPIVPNLGDYMTCIVGLLFPTIVYLTTSNIFEEHNYVEAKASSKKKFTWADAALACVFVGLVCLVGGVFNHKLIAIASNSMNPLIYRGDSVIISQNKNNKVYKKGDIISFDSNGRNTVHRITEIEEKNGQYYYHTKGDNNNSEDGYLVPSNNVYGKVVMRIPLIGYPSVLIQELRRDM